VRTSEEKERKTQRRNSKKKQHSTVTRKQKKQQSTESQYNTKRNITEKRQFIGLVVNVDARKEFIRLFNGHLGTVADDDGAEGPTI
jgi:hypothetical protein